MPLPPLLAGPIVRRAKADEVLFWLCTSEPINIGVELYAIDANRSPPLVNRGQPIGRGLALRRVRLGAKVYVHLLSAKPLPEKRVFPARQLIAYDVKRVATPGDWNTAGAGLSDLGGVESLTLGNLPLPTFVLQHSGRNDLRAIYSSCRKLHGKGPDASLCALHLLQSTAADPSRRPSSMFLTGDQIYADDVSILLIERIAALGIELQGTDEALPDLSGPARNIKPGGRQSIVNRTASLTSGEADAHLFTLGEFAATYLLAWNDHAELWPSRYRDNADLYWALADEAREKTTVAKFLDRYNEQLREVKDASLGSGRMRRVLANVASYMLFDDHEITDDWNLNDAWRQAAYGKPLARRIIANGLTAYWAFQAWGNAPERFDKAFIDGIEQHCQTLSPTNAAFDNLLINYRGWEFAAPTTPTAVFVDARTSRTRALADYDMRHPRIGAARSPKAIRVPRPPFPRNLLDLFPRTDGMPKHGSPDRLLDDAALGRLQPLCAPASSRPLVLIAGAPVFGLEMIEDAQDLLARMTGSYAFDLEHWHANPNSALDLFNMLLRVAPSRCVVLSGDVHYGYAALASISRAGQQLSCVQFTSSATKNGTPTVMRGLGMVQTARQLAERLNVFDFGRVTYRRPDGSTHILEIDDPVTLGLWQFLERALNQHGLREELRFFNMGWDRGFNSVLGPNNVGTIWFDGNDVKHQLHWVRSGQMAATPLVTIRG